MYLSVSSAGVSPVKSRITARVLQTETGFVSLSNLQAGVDVQEVIVAERIHAVIVSTENKIVITKCKYANKTLTFGT